MFKKIIDFRAIAKKNFGASFLRFAAKKTCGDCPLLYPVKIQLFKNFGDIFKKIYHFFQNFKIRQVCTG